GIRDFHVTGVQTCALPISNVDLMFVILCDAYLAAFSCLPARKRATYLTTLLDCSQPNHELTTEDLDDNVLDFLFAAQCIDIKPRSEERRVGKECRSRWWTY